MRITLEKGRFGWDYVICRCTGAPGQLDWNEKDESTTVLIQTDWDYPGVARTFGWYGAPDDISGAQEYLDSIAGFGKIVEDPGYFDDE